MALNFEKVKEGPRAGELVRLYPAGPAVKRTAHIPHNPSRTGYGAKIPTQYMVRTIDNVWRRVYCAVYSNSGTCYVMHGKVKTIVDFEGV